MARQAEAIFHAMGLGGVWRLIRGRGVRIRSTAELQNFLTSQASFLAQKSSIEYCRAKAGLNWSKLFKEAPFLEALERCRWEAFAAVLADMVVVTEGVLRLEAGGRGVQLADRLAAVYRDILTAHPVPAHRPQGWGDVMVALPPRLATAMLAEPQAPDRIARTSAGCLLEWLPIHRSLRGHDSEMVTNSVRFWMVAFKDRLVRDCDRPAVVEDLLGPPGLP